MLTDNGREFCGTERHPYELYLALNDIEHRKTKVRTPRTNGFVERFNGTVLEEFFRPVMHARAVRERRGAAGRARHLAAPLQPRATASRLPQPGPATMGDGRAICQTRRLRGQLTIPCALIGLISCVSPGVRPPPLRIRR